MGCLFKSDASRGRLFSGRLATLLRDEEGATAVEYAVMLALMIGAFFMTVQMVGQETQDSFDGSSSKIDEAFSEAGL